MKVETHPGQLPPFWTDRSVVFIANLLALFFGVDPTPLLQGMQGTGSVNVGSGGGGPVTTSPEEDEKAHFVSVVLADTEDVWRQLFQKAGIKYEDPNLVLFSGSVNSACGFTSAAVGPFYCPGDHKVYIDLAFYEEMKNKFGAPGDFAMAYVVAHEVGHHVQNLLGISDKVHRARSQLTKEEYNQLSVKLELQADFFAGVWAHHAQKMKNILEKGDVQEAMRAANAIGDDTLQKKSQGYVVPDAFTHGSSEQRMRWFMKGLKTGDLTQGDTFTAPEL